MPSDESMAKMKNTSRPTMRAGLTQLGRSNVILIPSDIGYYFLGIMVMITIYAGVKLISIESVTDLSAFKTKKAYRNNPIGLFLMR